MVYIKFFRHFTWLLAPGLLTLATSLTLVSCTAEGEKAQSPSAATNVSDTNSSGIKAKVLRIGYQSAGDLVRSQKVLEKRLQPLGVKVEWAQFVQGPQLMEAMNVGKIDLGAVGETPPIFAQAAGAQIVYVVGSRRTATTGRASVIAVPPNSPIKSVKDLKGQKIVFQKASASHYFVFRALEDAGLKPSDIKILSIPTVEASSAFLEGKIPVWVAGDPYLALAEKAGKIRVIKTAEGLDTPGAYYVGARKFAVENPGILLIVIEEIDKLQRWAEANPKEVAKIIGPIQKLPPDIIEKVVSRRSYGLRGISPELIKEQQRIADYFYKYGVIPKDVNIQEAVLTPEEYAAITPESISQK
ncbi:MAG: aliphatic sulfonate ABC transporter substrate-binding protein [Nostoc sp.]|uniref:aliphatic sulfonate ABC transporter substrate-binding protein n=1 Tax=Nostoc sp. TaxID=1180 RepID=UPI002FFC01D3